MTEIYEIGKSIAPPIMNSLFSIISEIFKNSRQKKETVLIMVWRQLHTGHLFTWAKLPSECTLAGLLTSFKSKIKSRKCEICTCRLCKEYEPYLGYI